MSDFLLSHTLINLAILVVFTIVLSSLTIKITGILVYDTVTKMVVCITNQSNWFFTFLDFHVSVIV